MFFMFKINFIYKLLNHFIIIFIIVFVFDQTL